MRAHPNITAFDGAQVKQGATLAFTLRSNGNPATVYQAETGNTLNAGPILTDAFGRCPMNVWLERGSYWITVSAPGMTSFAIPWEAVPGADGGVDAGYIANGAIGAGHINAGVITPDKLAEFDISHNFLLNGDISIYTFINPFFVILGPQQTVRLRRVIARLWTQGTTSITMTKNGVNLTGNMADIPVDTLGNTDRVPDSVITAVHGDYFAFTKTAGTGTPTDLTVGIGLDKG